MSEETPEQGKSGEVQIVTRAVETLVEHWDNVQIFCSRVSTDGKTETHMINLGRGNMFARVAQVRDWILRNDEMVREDARRDWEPL